MKASDTQTGGDHYKLMVIEPWDVADTWSPLERIGAYRHGVLKYAMRMGTKPGEPRLKDARKAFHYAQKLVETLEALEALNLYELRDPQTEAKVPAPVRSSSHGPHIQPQGNSEGVRNA